MVQAQYHTAGRSWYGDAKRIVVSSPGSQKIFWEELKLYEFEVTSAGTHDLLLPYDVRNFPIGGPYMLIANRSESIGTGLLQIKDADGGTTANISFSGITFPGARTTIVRGAVGYVFLTDNTTALGTWWIQMTPGVASAVTP